MTTLLLLSTVALAGLWWRERTERHRLLALLRKEVAELMTEARDVNRAVNS